MNSVAFRHRCQSEHVIHFSFLSYLAKISVSDGVGEGGEVGRKLVPHLQESGACSRPQSGSRARLGQGVGVEVETADARGASNRKCNSLWARGAAPHGAWSPRGPLAGDKGAGRTQRGCWALGRCSGCLESAGSAVAVGQERGGAARLRTGERGRGRGLLRCSRAP